MFYVMIASLAVNYLCIALIVLAMTADDSSVDWPQVAMLWPVTVPMLLIRKWRRR